MNDKQSDPSTEENKSHQSKIINAVFIRALGLYAIVFLATLLFAYVMKGNLGIASVLLMFINAGFVIIYLLLGIILLTTRHAKIGSTLILCAIIVLIVGFSTCYSIAMGN